LIQLLQFDIVKYKFSYVDGWTEYIAIEIDGKSYFL